MMLYKEIFTFSIFFLIIFESANCALNSNELIIEDRGFIIEAKGADGERFSLRRNLLNANVPVFELYAKQHIGIPTKVGMVAGMQNHSPDFVFQLRNKFGVSFAGRLHSRRGDYTVYFRDISAPPITCDTDTTFNFITCFLGIDSQEVISISGVGNNEYHLKIHNADELPGVIRTTDMLKKTGLLIVAVFSRSGKYIR